MNGPAYRYGQVNGPAYRDGQYGTRRNNRRNQRNVGDRQLGRNRQTNSKTQTVSQGLELANEIREIKNLLQMPRASSSHPMWTMMQPKVWPAGPWGVI